MANCHDLFQKFYDEIKLDTTKRKSLKKAKDAIRKKVKEYFKTELKVEPPKFWSQGSYALGTTVNPIDGEYDIDDGVYLQHIGNVKDEWPTPESVHKCVYDAVKGHTKEDPIDKRTCVRVVYSGEYHVDLPIYGTYAKKYHLAEKGDNGWHISDPQAFHEWFINNVDEKGEQLRTIIRYLKAWADYNSKTDKMPSGIILTVLAVEAYDARERDDAAFARTIKNIYQRISTSFIVNNPVDVAEDLTSCITETQKKNFVKTCRNLLENANKALEVDGKKGACKIWRKEFGDRFPCCDDIKDESSVLYTGAPAILKDDARSA